MPPLFSESHHAGTEGDVRKAFCIPLAMHSLADDTSRRGVAFKLIFMMIMMIFCPVYDVDNAGNLLPPTKAVRGRVDLFLGGEWRELWKDCQRTSRCEGTGVKARPSRGYTEEGGVPASSEG